MKQWISSPLNLILIFVGLFLLLMATQNLIKIYQLSTDELKKMTRTITIPSAKTFSIPPLRNYSAMVDAPLFWETRQVHKEPKKAELKEVPEKLTEAYPIIGRLTGIVNSGDVKMVIFKDDKHTHYINLDDFWGEWKVTNIDNNSVELQLLEEKQTLALVADFVAPAANKNKPALKKIIEHIPNRIKNKSAKTQLASSAKKLPHTASMQKQAPPLALPAAMTIKEALKSRQRLMAARWQKKS